MNEPFFKDLSTCLLFLILYFCSFFLFWGFGFLISSRLFDKSDIFQDHNFLLITGAFTAMMGYLIFWLFFINNILGRAAAIILICYCLYYFVLNKKKWPRLKDVVSDYNVFLPLLLMFFTGLLYLSLLYLFDVRRSPHQVARLRFQQWMPPDNIIPYMFANKLFNGGPPKNILTNWLSSDRPPLQAGLVLTQIEIGKLFNCAKLHYQLISTIAQSLWIPAVWSLCKNLSLSLRQSVNVIVLLIFTGFFFMSSVYVWPKLLAGAFMTGAYTLLLGKKREKDASKITIIFAAVMASLGLISHPGVAFTLIAIGLFLFIPRYFPGYRNIIIGILTALVFLLPWVAYQKFYDPPGNRLIKMHLGGATQFDDRSILQTIIDSYSLLKWDDYKRNKKLNIQMLWKDPLLEILTGKNKDYMFWGSIFSDKAFKDKLKFIRSKESRHVLISPGILNLGWILYIAVLIKNLFTDDEFKEVLPVKRIFFVVGTAILLWEMLIFTPGKTPIHHGSYANMILLFSALAIIISTLSNRFLIPFMVIHFSWFCLIWIIPSEKYRHVIINGFMSGTAVVSCCAIFLCMYYSHMIAKQTGMNIRK